VDFKDDDERCVEITQGRALDVLEIDGASNNGVEQVRELRDTAPYAPATCRYKVYIIERGTCSPRPPLMRYLKRWKNRRPM